MAVGSTRQESSTPKYVILEGRPVRLARKKKAHLLHGSDLLVTYLQHIAGTTIVQAFQIGLKELVSCHIR